MRVLICGDRHWDDCETISNYIKTLPPGTVIIEGEAAGADTIARIVAESFGLDVIKEPAQWAIYGRAAGPIRNQKMLDEHKPDCVVAFHNNISESRGTKDMVERARKAGVPVTIIGGSDKPKFATVIAASGEKGMGMTYQSVKHSVVK
jgi:hypothetical protein